MICVSFFNDRLHIKPPSRLSCNGRNVAKTHYQTTNWIRLCARYAFSVTSIVNIVCVNSLIDFKTSCKVSVMIAGNCKSIGTLEVMVATWNVLCIFQFFTLTLCSNWWLWDSENNINHKIAHISHHENVSSWPWNNCCDDQYEFH